jgi:hypothetical protein
VKQNLRTHTRRLSPKTLHILLCPNLKKIRVASLFFLAPPTPLYKVTKCRTNTWRSRHTHAHAYVRGLFATEPQSKPKPRKRRDDKEEEREKKRENECALSQRLQSDSLQSPNSNKM